METQTSGNLVTFNHFNLPIANTREIYLVEDVRKKLEKLTENGNGILRAVYERMIERGSKRFQVRPFGIPNMEHMYEELPNFNEVLDDVKRNTALSASGKSGFEMTPILLLGDPGVGKTHFAKKLAELLSTGIKLVPMSSMTAGWLLSGSSSQWRDSKPGKVFESLVDGEYSNPVILVDEIDKAGRDSQYDPLGALYSLLEHDTAKSFTDEFAEVEIDASQIIWVTTANDERSIPGPILNRMNVYKIEKPTPAQARNIAFNLYKSICSEHDWGQHFEPGPIDDLLDKLSEVSPRDMRRALMTAFGNARLAERGLVKVEDLPKPNSSKNKMGFLDGGPSR